MTTASVKEPTEKATFEQSAKQQFSIKKIFCKGILFEAASLATDILKPHSSSTRIADFCLALT